MKRVIYASSQHTFGEYEAEADKFRTVGSGNLVLSNSIAFPRHVSSEYHTSIHPIPTSWKDTSYTFEEATNLRIPKLEAQANTNDLPIVIFWSGGIDSTCTAAAVIKHLSPALMPRVVIQMNNGSYYENPFFFNNIIQKYKISSFFLFINIHKYQRYLD